MIDQEDKEISEWMSKLSEVPFRRELKVKILEAAKERTASELMRDGLGRRRHAWGRFLSVGTGLVAALLIVVVGFTQFHAKHGDTTATSKHVPFNANATEFGLQKAPVTISNIHIGTLPGDPKDADVLANVKNTSKSPIYESGLFGVLAFTPKNSNSENWLTFVNGPSGVIQPGQTVVWGFNPSGQALHARGESELIEKPHLKFYSSELVSTDVADTVWKRSTLQIKDIQVQPRDLGNGKQSVQINAQIQNTTRQPIHLAKQRAIIWFASTPTQSFLSDASIRFLYHLTPEYSDQNWPTTVQPGQTVAVNFRVLADENSDFFSRTPHVMIIHAPNVTS